MRIAWISPVCDAHQLQSAAYSRGVLPHFAAGWEVEVFVGEEDWRELYSRRSRLRVPTLEGTCYPVFHYHRLYERLRSKPFDCFVYQIEDHRRCSYAARAASIWPGVCCLHDLNLNTLYLSWFSHATAA